jgi:hypothetical protein
VNASAVVTRPEAAEALRFSTNRLTLGGLAYDSVSHRFLVGDRLGRKVMVVSEDSSSVIDLVRSDSAGFHDIAAVEIDAKRGDLWVASNELGDKTGALHRLQLVSGRPLRTYPVSSELGPVTLADIAVEPSGNRTDGRFHEPAGSLPPDWQYVAGTRRSGRRFATSEPRHLGR